MTDKYKYRRFNEPTATHIDKYRITIDGLKEPVFIELEGDILDAFTEMLEKGIRRGDITSIIKGSSDT